MSRDRKDEFKVYVPLDVFEKSGERFVKGYITTEHRDREDETILQGGLDFDDFLKSGYFNDNHSKKTADAVGYPLKVERRPHPDGTDAHYVEGKLLKGYEPAEKIWALAQALKADGNKRQLGFSLQGSILHRSGPAGKTISKARVRHVAITSAPVNPYTGMDLLAKALMAGSVTAEPAGGPAPGEAFALRQESLEGAGTGKKKRKKKRMSKSEAVAWLQRRGYSQTVAERLYALARRS